MTFGEMVIKGVDSDNWYALLTTKGTSPADINRLNKAVQRLLADEAVKTCLLNSGAQTASSTPAALADLLARDSDKWARVIRRKNILPQ